MVQISPSRAIAAEVRAAIARKQIRQSDLASQMGLSPSALSLRLNGKQGISIEEMVRLAEILEADPVEWMKAAS